MRSSLVTPYTASSKLPVWVRLFYTYFMMMAIAPIKVLVSSAYDHALDQQIAGGLKQACDSSVQKFSIAGIAASTKAIIARCKPLNPK